MGTHIGVEDCDVNDNNIKRASEVSDVSIQLSHLLHAVVFYSILHVLYSLVQKHEHERYCLLWLL